MDLHEEITKLALQASALSANANRATFWEFHKDAVAQIADENSDVDCTTIAGLWPGTAADHFDDNLLHEGAERVRTLRTNILTRLAEAEAIMASPAPSPAKFEDLVEESQQYLGNAHHAIQDFYAHSNWIESERSGIAGMVWLDGQGPNPFPAFSESSCLCGSEVQSTDVVTGTFRWHRDLMYIDARNGRCVHGPGSPSIPLMSCPVDGSGNIAGLNKDNAGSTAQQAQWFTTAKTKAIQASAAFTQSILLQLEKQRQFVALCGFLGHGDSRACLGEVKHDFEKDFNFTQFSTGNYKTDEVFAFDIPKFDPELGTLRGITSNWTITVDGSAVCPASPGSAVAGADLCVGLRRVANLAVTSPETGANALYCKTSPDLKTVTCGFGAMLPDNQGISYHIWPGGSQPIDLEFKDEFRYLSPPASFIASDQSSVFRIDGTFVSRMLLYLGKNNGPGAEPSIYPSSGGYLSFVKPGGTGPANVNLSLSVRYEYVRTAAAIAADAQQSAEVAR